MSVVAGFEGFWRVGQSSVGKGNVEKFEESDEDGDTDGSLPGY